MVKSYTDELVYTESKDGIILAGLVVRPRSQAANPIATVWIPGLSINFYHPSFVAIGRELAGLGCSFVIGKLQCISSTNCRFTSAYSSSPK